MAARPARSSVHPGGGTDRLRKARSADALAIRGVWKTVGVAGVGALAVAIGCRGGGEKTFTQVAKGRKVSVVVGVTRSGGLDVPTLTIRNDSSEDLRLSTVKMTGTFESGRSKETVPGALERERGIVTQPKGATLAAGGTYILPGIWEDATGDCLERVRIEVAGETFAFRRPTPCP